MVVETLAKAAIAQPPQELLGPGELALTVAAIYDRYADFVYKSLRHLGVPESSVDDALQDVFLVVHRRLAEFEGTAHTKTWLFRIAMHVAQDVRKRLARGEARRASVDEDALIDYRSAGPLEHALQAEKVRLLQQLLEELDEDKRVVFILAEIEQLPVKQIAETLSTNVNTIYSRVRAARAAFEVALSRARAGGRS